MTAPATSHAPNHHAHHPGFAGVGGLLAGLSMTVRRRGDARLAVRLTGVHAGDHLVDVGCGPGSAVRFAAGLGVHVTGVDPASVMLRLARRLTGSRVGITYVEGAAESLPVPDGVAAVVWTIASVHHWADLAAGLAEVRRVLAPGGRLLAVERHTRPGATGLASHGWTDEQGAAFADLCRAQGFDEVRLDSHKVGRRPVLTVVATSR